MPAAVTMASSTVPRGVRMQIFRSAVDQFAILLTQSQLQSLSVKFHCLQLDAKSQETVFLDNYKDEQSRIIVLAIKRFTHCD